MNRDQKVVVVDDDAKVVMLLENILTELGFQVLSAGEGKTALELVKKERPGLLISDILQPGIDGIGLCQSIKQDPQLENIKVILMSGVYKEASFKLEMACKPDAFIDKPLEVRKLKDLVVDIFDN